MVNEIPIIPAIIETDEHGSLINSLPREFQTLYTYINKIYNDLNAAVTNIKVEVKKLNERYDDKEIVDKHGADSALNELNGRCLNLEETIKNITNQQIPNLKLKKSDYVRHDTLNKIIGNLENREKENLGDVNRIVRENLTNANKQHKQFLDFKIEIERNVTPIVDTVNNNYIKGNSNPTINTDKFVENSKLLETKQELSLMIKKNRDDMFNYINSIVDKSQEGQSNDKRSKHTKEIRNMNLKNNLETLASYDSTGIENMVHDEQKDSPIKIDCDVLFLTDSNLYRMDCSINYGTNCQKFKCPLIKDVLNIIENGTCDKNVDCVYIQCGTNDLDHEDVESISYRLSDIADKAKQKFKDAKIVISSILPRKDKKNEVDRLNKYLSDLCDVTKRVKFMENLMITEDMLRDRKHLDDLGFKILLTNIRYNIFGKIKVRKNSSKYGQKKRANGYNSYGSGRYGYDNYEVNGYGLYGSGRYGNNNYEDNNR